MAFGPDEDLDGIVDTDETGDGAGSEGSLPDLTDSDNEGLPAGVEDLNRNGKWDMEQGETAAYLADSDNDGVSDWYETHGDGRYDPVIDTDPLNPDTDKDGIPDGAEDKNGNGIWETHLGETDPRSAESDGDGYPDDQDTCPSLYNPGQEPWYCPTP